MDFSEQKNKTLEIKGIKETRQIIIENIIYLESIDLLTAFYMLNYEKIECSQKSLEFYKKELEHIWFIMINEKVIINLKYFKHHKNKPKRCIELLNNIEFIVSRRKWWIFQEYMKT